jgi:hypothetical protein
MHTLFGEKELTTTIVKHTLFNKQNEKIKNIITNIISLRNRLRFDTNTNKMSNKQDTIFYVFMVCCAIFFLTFIIKSIYEILQN